jgi:4-hydroxy-3-polyprenylbenzoate decarboxylase
VNGPAVRSETSPAHVELASGLYSGPDRTQVRDPAPWPLPAVGLGHDSDISYCDFLAAFRLPGGGEPPTAVEEIRAEPVEADLYALGLPAVGTQGPPAVSMGLLILATDEGTRWFPARGTVRGGHRIRAVVPAPALDRVSDRTEATLVLGVPAAVLVGAIGRWTGGAAVDRASHIAGALDDIEVAHTDRGALPADAEVFLHGTVWAGDAPPAGPAEAWELGTETTVVKFRADAIETRPDPVLPFSPSGHPLADDRQLVSFAESARLFHRVNQYWGTSPVEWIALPAEAGLGVCLVASEVLYAGFEWQLANTMFSFSDLFDKVLLLDTAVPPMDYGRAFDDLWVKAHPSHNWIFSEPDAPAASVPAYREDETGSRLYINATWDPTWDEEYIAPRVSFENSFPAEVREFVREHWVDMGFSAPLVEDG